MHRSARSAKGEVSSSSRRHASPRSHHLLLAHLHLLFLVGREAVLVVEHGIVVPSELPVGIGWTTGTSAVEHRVHGVAGLLVTLGIHPVAGTHGPLRPELVLTRLLLLLVIAGQLLMLLLRGLERLL